MKTLLVLRHADVDDPPNPLPVDWSPDLNIRGKERAEALADLLGDAGIATVIVSPAPRTQQTAAPLVGKLGFSSHVLPTWSQTVAEALLPQTGDVVVIIGHSNTVPKIINTLGGPMSATAILQGHDDLFVVTVVAPGAVSFLHLTYGKKTLPPV